MSGASSSSPEHTAATPRPAARLLDVIVCVRAPSKGLLRRMRRLLRQCKSDTRVILVDAGGIDALLWSRLQGLARDAGALLLLRHESTGGGPSCVELGLAHAAQRDVLLLGAELRFYAGFLKRLRAVLLEDPKAGFVSPLSNRSRRARDPAWSGGVPELAGLSAKRAAKLIQGVSPRTRPELVAPDATCMLLRHEVLQALGAPPDDPDNLARYVEQARGRGFRALLADDVYVQHPDSDFDANASASPELPLAKVLAWHARRGTAQNLRAPLILLD
ncbi:MAG TPA: hypothetical protein VK524_09360, partial [Polyangiaceae bacterium]|nr:hypothetical protein [Polyangiaceae bacterium]